VRVLPRCATKDARASAKPSRDSSVRTRGRKRRFISERERAGARAYRGRHRITEGTARAVPFSSAHEPTSTNRKAIVALLFTLTTINAWNRLAITMRTEVGTINRRPAPGPTPKLGGGQPPDPGRTELLCSAAWKVRRSLLQSSTEEESMSKTQHRLSRRRAEKGGPFNVETLTLEPRAETKYWSRSWPPACATQILVARDKGLPGWRSNRALATKAGIRGERRSGCLSKSRLAICRAHILTCGRCKPCRLEGWHIASKTFLLCFGGARLDAALLHRRRWREVHDHFFGPIVVCDIRTRQ